MVLPNGFWAVDGFSRTKSRLLAAFPARKPEIQEMQGALEMASGKGAGIAKSTILVLLWGSPHLQGVLQNRQFWCFCGAPPISAALEAGNPRNTTGLGNGLRKRSGYCKIGKWPPEKERALQIRRFWCFYGVPRITAALEAGNPRNTRGLRCTLFFST